MFFTKLFKTELEILIAMVKKKHDVMKWSELHSKQKLAWQ